MAVAPSVVTVPVTSLTPSLNLKVSVLKVEPLINMEKVASTNVSIGISVSPSSGLTEVTVNSSVGGGSGVLGNEVVVKLQVELEFIALPAKSFTPVVIVAVYIVSKSRFADGVNVAVVPL